MDHFTKVSLPDFTDLHMTLAFIEEQKSTAGEGAEWRAIIVLSRLLCFHKRWRSKSKLNFD